jgi:ligand-binding sensor domain-containing protein/signal transduction histidine kinase
MVRFLTLFFLVGLLPLVPALAQARSAIFDHLSVEDGLSQSEVMCIYKDRDGFMWFGTGDGLNRYDGYTFTYFKNSPFDSASLSHNRVLSLHQDAKGNLWVGTLNGLNRIDRATRSVTRFPEVIPEDKNVLLCAINQIYEDKWGTIWLGTNAGLMRLVAETPERKTSRYQVKRYTHAPEEPNSISHNNVSAILEDKSGRIWVGTANGLNQLKIEKENLPPAQQKISWLNATNDSSPALGEITGMVTALEEDRGGNLWVGTYQNGLFRVEAGSQTVTQITHQPNTPGSLSSNEINSLLCDQRGVLWVGTFQHGLNISRLPAQVSPVSFDTFRDDLHERNSLQSGGITTLFEGRNTYEDVVWIGTRGSGISKYSRTKNSFTIWSNLMGSEQYHASLSTFAISTDREKNVWIGTLNGLFRIDPQQKVTHFTHAPGDSGSLSHNMVLHLFTDRQGRVWVGTRNGLNRFEPAKNSFQRYRFSNHNKALPENEILKMYQDREGTLWVGTGYDLKEFDPVSGKAVSYSHDPKNKASLKTYFITSIQEDTAGFLWVGTHFGLNKMDRQKGTFTHYQHSSSDPNSLISNAVLALMLDQKGQLWISTDKGLSRMRSEKNSGSFENFTEQNGLRNGFVYGTLEDRQGILWLSTNLGLSRFDPYNKSFKNYDVSDGLPHNEFNMGAFHESGSGELFFGGNRGVVSFHPERLERNRNVPTIRITHFSKMQKPVQLDSLLQAQGQVVLTHKDSGFSFEFVALDYTNPIKNRYAYKLEGFNDNWVETGNRRYASFSNLSPGEYTFRVKGSNSDGIWNVDPQASVQLVIKPPFWRTLWFYGLAVLGFGLVTMLYNNFRIRRRVERLLELEKVKLAENERVRKLAAEDLHDEFGNRLTRISLLTELIKVKLNGHYGEVSPLLSKISENSNQLYHGTKDFIWSINPDNDSFYEVAVRLKDFGDELFYNTPIHFQATGLTEDLRSVRLPMGTSRHLILLFKEAMNNIIKYAECQNVQLQFQKKALLWCIKLTDDGKGFDKTIDRGGNGLGNMESRAKKVGGKVIITSGKGKGTTIEFMAAIPNSGGYIVNH